MTHRSAARMHPMDAAVPYTAAGQSDGAGTTGSGVAALVERATQEILAVTYWFDPDPQPAPYPVTIRFSGHRVDVTRRRLHRHDRFMHDESIEAVVPGSGPISITAKVRGIHPGEWAVSARVLNTTHPVHSIHTTHGQRESGNMPPAGGGLGPAIRLWRRWAPPVGSDTLVSTSLVPFAHVPGVLPLSWAAMVALGMAVALVVQSLVIARDQLAVGPVWAWTLIAIAVGIAGAKGWYIFLHRGDYGIDRWAGWCIQGFITGATLAAAMLFTVFHAPTEIVLDATAPGLLIGLAVGRVGCFFAGCCGGPPTASRWGVWSSDQRVGARRMPTQLLEAALALSLGLGVLAVVLGRGPAGGAYFVAALAAYTLGRQALLRLRAEPRQTRLGGPVTAALAALVLVAAVVDVSLLAR